MVKRDGFEKFDDHYICGICHMIVKDPSKCADCEDLYCQGCINEWLERSKACPKC